MGDDASRFRDRATRLEWRHRIEDHDGDVGAEGGIERWLKLTEGLGLDSAYVESTEGILPALESAHAVAQALKLAPTLSPHDILVVNLSGRGDKDMGILAQELKLEESGKVTE